jgi:hypothetical protein
MPWMYRPPLTSRRGDATLPATYYWNPVGAEPAEPNVPSPDAGGRPALNQPPPAGFDAVMRRVLRPPPAPGAALVFGAPAPTRDAALYVPIGEDRGTPYFQALAAHIARRGDVVTFAHLSRPIRADDERSALFAPELAARYGRLHILQYMMTNPVAVAQGYEASKGCYEAAVSADHVNILEWLATTSVEADRARCVELALVHLSKRALRWMATAGWLHECASAPAVREAVSKESVARDADVALFLASVQFPMPPAAARRSLARLMSSRIGETSDIKAFLAAYPDAAGGDTACTSAAASAADLDLLQHLHRAGGIVDADTLTAAAANAAWDCIVWMHAELGVPVSPAARDLIHRNDLGKVMAGWLRAAAPVPDDGKRAFVPSLPPCWRSEGDTECPDTAVDTISHECIPRERLYKNPNNGHCHDIDQLYEWYLRNPREFDMPDRTGPEQFPRDLLTAMKHERAVRGDDSVEPLTEAEMNEMARAVGARRAGAATHAKSVCARRRRG